MVIFVYMRERNAFVMNDDVNIYSWDNHIPPRITLGRYNESDFDNEYRNYLKFGWEPMQPKYNIKKHLL